MKNITFIKSAWNIWKCVHNDFYLDFNPGRLIDLTNEPNFINEIIDEDIASRRFSYENVKNKIC